MYLSTRRLRVVIKPFGLNLLYTSALGTARTRRSGKHFCGLRTVSKPTWIFFSLRPFVSEIRASRDYRHLISQQLAACKKACLASASSSIGRLLPHALLMTLADGICCLPVNLLVKSPQGSDRYTVTASDRAPAALESWMDRCGCYVRLGSGFGCLQTVGANGSYCQGANMIYAAHLASDRVAT